MKRNWIYWNISLVVSVGATLIIKIFFHIEDIIHIQFAPSAKAMRELIEGIDLANATNAYHLLKMNTIFDYVFILGYTILIFFSFQILLGLFEAKTAKWVYVVTLLPGFFDCMENVVLVSSAVRQREDFSHLYFNIVRIKWGVSIAPIMITSIILIYSLVLIFRTRTQHSSERKYKNTEQADPFGTIS